MTLLSVTTLKGSSGYLSTVLRISKNKSSHPESNYAPVKHISGELLHDMYAPSSNVSEKWLLPSVRIYCLYKLILSTHPRYLPTPPENPSKTQLRGWSNKPNCVPDTHLQGLRHCWERKQSSMTSDYIGSVDSITCASWVTTTVAKEENLRDFHTWG